MNLTVKELQRYEAIRSFAQLESASKKDVVLARIYKTLLAKIAERKQADYVNQKVQTQVINKVFVITSTKYTMTKEYKDAFELTSSEVKKLQDLKLSYKQFKSLFAFVSKFILCNYSTKENLCKHERFYSQCLAQVNLVLNKFTDDVIHSRSKHIKIKDITRKNIADEFADFNKLLFAKTSVLKAEAKQDLTKQEVKQEKTKRTAKLIKAIHKTKQSKSNVLQNVSMQ